MTTQNSRLSKIVSVHLIKNEDVFIEQSISNVIHYVDEVIILDNKSTDKTKEIITNTWDRDLKSGKMKYVIVQDARDTNKYLQEFIGTNTWVWGIDGDEVYSYMEANKICCNIRTHQYDNYYRLDMEVLNVTNIANGLYGKHITGYKSPPSKGMIKLYNFKYVESISPGERLHGDYKTTNNSIYFYGTGKICMLHMCFMKRSSIENIDVRPAPEGHGGVGYKMEAYRKGSIVQIMDVTREFIQD